MDHQQTPAPTSGARYAFSTASAGRAGFSQVSFCDASGQWMELHTVARPNAWAELRAVMLDHYLDRSPTAAELALLEAGHRMFPVKHLDELFAQEVLF